jgi:hypothetical protein
MPGIRNAAIRRHGLLKRMKAGGGLTEDARDSEFVAAVMSI